MCVTETELDCTVIIYNDISSCNNSLILTVQQVASINGTTVKINVNKAATTRTTKKKKH